MRQQNGIKMFVRLRYIQIESRKQLPHSRGSIQPSDWKLETTHKTQFKYIGKYKKIGIK